MNLLRLICKIPPLWTPANMTTNLWLDANDSSTVQTVNSGGIRVTQWNDKSGGSRNVSQANTGLAPLYSSNQLNGKPGIVFQNTNTQTLDSTATLPAGSTYSWIVLVKDDRSTATISEPFSTGTSLSSSSMELVLDYDGSVTSGVMCGFNGSVLGKASGSTVKSKATIISIGLNAGVGNARINGVNGTNGGSGVTTAATVFSVGRSRPQNTFYLYGVVFEIVAIPEAIGSTNFLKVEGYLAWKWGIQGDLPAGHPYKNAPPYA